MHGQGDPRKLHPLRRFVQQRRRVCARGIFAEASRQSDYHISCPRYARVAIPVRHCRGRLHRRAADEGDAIHGCLLHEQFVGAEFVPVAVRNGVIGVGPSDDPLQGRQRVAVRARCQRRRGEHLRQRRENGSK